jgi:hypothetical protein
VQSWIECRRTSACLSMVEYSFQHPPEDPLSLVQARGLLHDVLDYVRAHYSFMVE